jgi:type IV secretion system protein TrbL
MVSEDMKTRSQIKAAIFFLFLGLAFFSLDASADVDGIGVLDDVLARYSAVATTWSNTITARATWLFWTLVLISMVWTFGMMALRKADMGEFFAEFVRFTIFTGFFWWLLINGPHFALSIMDSLRQIGGAAAGTGPDLTPSGIVDIGFQIFSKVIVQSSAWSPVNSAIGILMSVVILVIMALIGVNMLLLLISGWILAYAGVFFLGFGGARWTSDIAINYYKTVLSIAAQLFTMVLLVGIGKSFVDMYYAGMSSGIRLNELGVMLIVSVVLLVLVNRVPPMIGQIPMGGGAGAIGGGFGAGAVVTAAAMAGAAAATMGAAAVAGTASMAGGAQALMTAFTKANAAESAGSGASALMAAISHGGASGANSSKGGSPLADAMGNDTDSPSLQTGGSNNGKDAGVSLSRSDAQGEGGDNGGSKAGDPTTSSQSRDADTSTIGSNSEGNGATKGEKAKSKLAGTLASVGKVAAKTGLVSAGTAANLARGTMDVAKAKWGSTKQAALDRIGETTGGKIAAAIQVRNEASQTSTSATSSFDGNSLSAGNPEPVDAEAEVAAFRDKGSNKEA